VAVTALTILAAGCGRVAAPRPAVGGPPSPATPVHQEEPSRPSSATPSFQPSAIAFWDGRHGLAVGTGGCPEGCGGAILATADGGRTWTVARAEVAPVVDVAVTGSADAWAVSSRCGSPPFECQGTLLRSGDAGRTWRSAASGAFAPSFATPAIGWAVSAVTGDLHADILATADGGANWRPISSPCKGERPTVRAVSLPTPARGWALCAGLPGAGQQMKAVYVSDDGGKTWRLAGDPGGGGYAAGLFFRPNGVGWLWESRGGMLATADGGRTWRPVGVTRAEVVEARSVWFPSDRTGFALLRDNERRVWALDRTDDGGATWTTVHTWPTD
jgi:photosystem II stability/assembly factor-like uncharacterized protein